MTGLWRDFYDFYDDGQWRLKSVRQQMMTTMSIINYCTVQDLSNIFKFKTGFSIVTQVALNKLQRALVSLSLFSQMLQVCHKSCVVSELLLSAWIQRHFTKHRLMWAALWLSRGKKKLNRVSGTCGFRVAASTHPLSRKRESAALSEDPGPGAAAVHQGETTSSSGLLPVRNMTLQILRDGFVVRHQHAMASSRYLCLPPTTSLAVNWP